MKNKGIFKKLLLIFTINSAAVLSAFIFISSYYLKQNNIKVFTEDLEESAHIITPYIAELYNSGNIETLAKYLKTGADKNRRITIVRKDGVVAADSHADAADMDNHLNRSEIKEAFEKGRAVSIRRSSTLNEDLLYVAVPIYKDGQTIAALRINAPVRNITLLSKDFFSKNITAFLILFVLSLISAYLFSGLLAGRITKLKNAFGRLARGDFEARTNIESGDELEELSDTFNEMSEKMAKMFSDKEQSRAELSGIIESVKDIVLVVNKNGFVTVSNNTAYKNKYYWEIDGLVIFNKYIGRQNTAEIDLGGKYYSCSLSAIKNTSDTVIVMHDITEIKNLETIKNDFISNMSHELKTPLASIKLYLELIATENDERTKEEYLQAMTRNNERLANITNDILLLSRVEEKKQIQYSQFNMREVLKEVGALLEDKAKSKGLKLELHDNDAVLNADKFYIEQMLINLVDNAVRYTENGRIDVDVEQDDFGTKITVADTGIGIAKENLPRIFERFFVADKSRSKKTGGTGLGLAIVKHIVEAHGGIINVSSELGKGATFVIRLP
ncbi:MAG: HAMP domain-containing protein [Elusimicrobiota bacterium]|jgi:two-component system phosphate regulon sensor histidine kinase PhoR|nr:HAMP domain-containing protein [Elusimicrobiota bacterium]